TTKLPSLARSRCGRQLRQMTNHKVQIDNAPADGRKQVRRLGTGARHPVLESYGVIHPTDIVCRECGQAVYHGSKKKDAVDATLPKSIYACKCVYLSSTQLVLPLRVEEWGREVKRARGDGAVVQKGSAAIDPLLRAASEVNTLHGELLAMGLEMIVKMIVIGEKL